MQDSEEQNKDLLNADDVEEKEEYIIGYADALKTLKCLEKYFIGKNLPGIDKLYMVKDIVVKSKPRSKANGIRDFLTLVRK